jgi:type VI secretion system protein ImpB
MSDSMSNSDLLRQEKESFANVRMPLPSGNGLDTDEMPFIVAVMDDFRGNARKAVEARGELVDRKFDKVTRYTLGEKLAELNPGLEYDVKSTLPNSTESTVRVSLSFNQMKDFSPKRVAEQVPQLASLLLLAERLRALKNRAGARPETRKEIEKLIAELIAANAK